MPIRTFAQLASSILSRFVTGSPGNIGAVDHRDQHNDIIDTLEQYIKGTNATERGAIVHHGPTDQTALTIRYKGASQGAGIKIYPFADQEGIYALAIFSHPTATTPKVYFDAFGGFYTDRPIVNRAGSMPNYAPLMHMVVPDVLEGSELHSAVVDGSYPLGFADVHGRYVSRIRRDGTPIYDKQGTGAVTRSPNGDYWELTPSNAGASVWTKARNFNSAGVATTPAHITSLKTALGGTVYAWARDARVTVNEGQITAMPEASGGGGFDLTSVEPSSTPIASYPVAARFARPEFGWSAFATAAPDVVRFRNGERMETPNLTDIRTLVYVGTVWPDDRGEQPMMRITDPPVWFGWDMAAGTIRGHVFDGSSVFKPDSTVAGDRSIVRCVILRREASAVTIQVLGSRVSSPTTVTLTNPRALSVGGHIGDWAKGDMHACLALPVATTAGQDTDIRNWANANYGAVIT